jgi:hypothetical protein
MSILGPSSAAVLAVLRSTPVHDRPDPLLASALASHLAESNATRPVQPTKFDGKPTRTAGRTAPEDRKRRGSTPLGSEKDGTCGGFQDRVSSGTVRAADLGRHGRSWFWCSSPSRRYPARADGLVAGPVLAPEDLLQLFYGECGLVKCSMAWQSGHMGGGQ